MKKINLLLILLFLLPTQLSSINLKKLKSKAKKEIKKVEKKITKTIKPLEIKMEVSNISYNPLKSLNTLVVTVDFKGHNPNDLGVTFNRTEFDLYANDAHLSKFYNDKKIKIPKDGPFSFQEKAEVGILEAGKTIFNAILKKNAVYTVVGTYFIDTPIGSFSFKAKMLEKEVNPKDKR